ncbi:MAG: hypothetical protein K1000chlam2_00050 [Chlamydiae bacterium]|nr:hypothetical protein [Chlamydiota bacterium]
MYSCHLDGDVVNLLRSIQADIVYTFAMDIFKIYLYMYTSQEVRYHMLGTNARS